MLSTGAKVQQGAKAALDQAETGIPGLGLGQAEAKVPEGLEQTEVGHGDVQSCRQTAWAMSLCPVPELSIKGTQAPERGDPATTAHTPLARHPESEVKGWG